MEFAVHSSGSEGEKVRRRKVQIPAYMRSCHLASFCNIVRNAITRACALLAARRLQGIHRNLAQRVIASDRRRRKRLGDGSVLRATPQRDAAILSRTDYRKYYADKNSQGRRSQIGDGHRASFTFVLYYERAISLSTLEASNSLVSRGQEDANRF